MGLSKGRALIPLFFAVFAIGRAATQELPVSSVSLFSSGVGYFEHRGKVSGDATIDLPFTAKEIDDVLKSLVIRDFAGKGEKAPSGSSAPDVSYPSLEPLDEALHGLKVDLSGAPNVAELLRGLRGAELAVDTPEEIVGRIVGVENRPTGFQGKERSTLILLTDKGVRSIALDDLASFRFTDPSLMSDFNKALSLILEGRRSDRRSLEIHLHGTGNREAALGYVIATPVWKASYRLDLSGPDPWIQGWAIVDNPSQMDWRGVRLSLVSGKPVSFIQELYAPLRVDRPVIPLSIAGTAEARTYESGTSGSIFAEGGEDMLGRGAPAFAPQAAPKMAESAAALAAPAPRSSAFDFQGGGSAAAETRAAGDQFEFTVKSPVNLDRGRSAMIPLVASTISAQKVSIFTADSGERNPLLGVRLSNTLGMKLPAGPITVFDGGTYAGDALMEFFPEKDRRLVVYGQDLSVTGDEGRTSARETVGVKIAKGVLTFSRRVTWTRTYEFRNASANPRNLVIEHPIMGGAELLSPSTFEEKTDAYYRFALALPASGQARLEVKERMPASERVVITGLGSERYLSYASSSDMPQAIADALRRAATLAGRLEEAKKALSDLMSRRGEITSDQARIRQNLEAVGRDSTQGQQYLKRLMDSESSLDDLAAKTAKQRQSVADAQAALDDYIGGLNLGG